RLRHLPSFAGRKRSRKALPGGLAGDAEGGADLGPTDPARAQQVDNPLQLIALALDGVLDWLQALEQALGRQLLRRDLGHRRHAVGDDLVAERHALVADEDVRRTRDQLPHVVLRWEAEGAVQSSLRFDGAIAGGDRFALLFR